MTLRILRISKSDLHGVYIYNIEIFGRGSTPNSDNDKNQTKTKNIEISNIPIRFKNFVLIMRLVRPKVLLILTNTYEGLHRTFTGRVKFSYKDL